eukprot:12436695-Alexandrium_andersonii.AAC.1
MAALRSASGPILAGRACTRALLSRPEVAPLRACCVLLSGPVRQQLALRVRSVVDPREGAWRGSIIRL